MAVKLTMQGALIYVTMAGCLAAFVLFVFGRRTGGWAVYAATFAAAAASYAYRWVHVGHVPMQNVFEAMLLVGAVMFPLTVLGRVSFGVRMVWADPLIAFVVLFPVGFVLSEAPQHLPPALQSPLFVPHVLSYMLAYTIIAKATVQAIAQLAVVGADDGRRLEYERCTYRLVCLGFPFLTAGLVLGAWWGRLAWTRHWGWDPKESWSLATWLVVVVYLHVRSLPGKRRATLNAALVVLAMVLIILTMGWVIFPAYFPDCTATQHNSG